MTTTNDCDGFHSYIERNIEVRVLPNSRGDPHSNSLVCRYHYDREMFYRHQMVTNGTWAEDATDFSTWESLAIYTESKP